MGVAVPWAGGSETRLAGGENSTCVAGVDVTGGAVPLVLANGGGAVRAMCAVGGDPYAVPLIQRLARTTIIPLSEPEL